MVMDHGRSSARGGIQAADGIARQTALLAIAGHKPHEICRIVKTVAGLEFIHPSFENYE